MSEENIKYDPLIETLGIKVKTRKELAAEYGISVKTLNKRIKEAGLEIPTHKLLFPNKLKLIYYTLGIPSVPKKS